MLCNKSVLIESIFGGNCLISMFGYMNKVTMNFISVSLPTGVFLLCSEPEVEFLAHGCIYI